MHARGPGDACAFGGARYTSGTFRSQRRPVLAGSQAPAQIELCREHDLGSCPLDEIERLAVPPRADDLEAVGAQLTLEIARVSVSGSAISTARRTPSRLGPTDGHASCPLDRFCAVPSPQPTGVPRHGTLGRCGCSPRLSRSSHQVVAWTARAADARRAHRGRRRTRSAVRSSSPAASSARARTADVSMPSNRRHRPGGGCPTCRRASITRQRPRLAVECYVVGGYGADRRPLRLPGRSTAVAGSSCHGRPSLAQPLRPPRPLPGSSTSSAASARRARDANARSRPDARSAGRPHPARPPGASRRRGRARARSTRSPGERPGIDTNVATVRGVGSANAPLERPARRSRLPAAAPARRRSATASSPSAESRSPGRSRRLRVRRRARALGSAPGSRHPRHGLGVVAHSGKVWAIAGGTVPGLSVTRDRRVARVALIARYEPTIAAKRGSSRSGTRSSSPVANSRSRRAPRRPRAGARERRRAHRAGLPHTPCCRAARPRSSYTSSPPAVSCLTVSKSPRLERSHHPPVQLPGARPIDGTRPATDAPTRSCPHRERRPYASPPGPGRRRSCRSARRSRRRRP